MDAATGTSSSTRHVRFISKFKLYVHTLTLQASKCESVRHGYLVPLMVKEPQGEDGRALVTVHELKRQQ